MGATVRSVVFGSSAGFGGAGIVLSGGTLELLPGPGSTVTHALHAKIYVNGDGATKIANIGDGTGAGGLLGETPVESKLISGAISFGSDNDFRNFFLALAQDDFYQSLFIGDLNIPDLNGGAAYPVEFGAQNADDYLAIYVDRNKNGLFETAVGEQLIFRGCCGGGANTISLAPGTYRYAAAHAEVGGGSALVPTIDLTPDVLGPRIVNPGAMGGLFSRGLFSANLTNVVTVQRKLLDSAWRRPAGHRLGHPRPGRGQDPDGRLARRKSGARVQQRRHTGGERGRQHDGRRPAHPEQRG